MKSIVIKTKNGASCYMSPFISRMNDDGEWEEVIQTDEEQEQECYRSLIEDVQQKEFNKNIVAVLKAYLGEEKIKDWTFIQIKFEFSTERQLELGISNHENIQWNVIPDK